MVSNDQVTVRLMSLVTECLAERSERKEGALGRGKTSEMRDSVSGRAKGGIQIGSRCEDKEMMDVVI